MAYQIEYKIGETFDFKNIKLKCIEVKIDSCTQNIKERCFFSICFNLSCKHLNCSCESRSDKKPVIFMEV